MPELNHCFKVQSCIYVRERANNSKAVVTQYGEGGDLLKWRLAIPGALNEDFARFIILPAFESIFALHKMFNVAHRDIKVRANNRGGVCK